MWYANLRFSCRKWHKKWMKTRRKKGGLRSVIRHNYPVTSLAWCGFPVCFCLRLPVCLFVCLFPTQCGRLLFQSSLSESDENGERDRGRGRGRGGDGHCRHETWDMQHSFSLLIIMGKYMDPASHTQTLPAWPDQGGIHCSSYLSGS